MSLPHYDFTGSVIETADNGYLVVGTSEGFGSDNNDRDLWIVKLTGDGVVQWQKYFDGAANEYGLAVQQAADGTPNETGETAVLAAAESAKNAGIEIFTIGLGPEINSQLLEAVATDAEHFYNAPTTNELSDIYRQIVGELNCNE
ncbi:MAG: VWA domain-containing protein [Chloroflexi bacterium]|nr:VWA domain-containing protein [Chloroflexota bacterium]